MSRSTLTFILAVLLIPAAVFSLAYYFSMSLKADLSDLTSALDSIESSILADDGKNSEVMELSVDTFNKKWKICSERWCFFFDHEQIHQVELMRTDLVSEVRNTEYKAALITVSKIRCAFDMMSEHDALSISNFF